MNCFFNELSVIQTTIANAQKAMESFVDTCICLQHFGFNTLSYTHHLGQFTQLQLAKNYYVYSWQKDETIDIELRRRFKTILEKIVSNTEQVNHFFHETQENQPVWGLAMAYTQQTLAASFYLHETWNKHTVTIIATNSTRNEEVKHVSLSPHLLHHTALFYQKKNALITFPQTNKPLPYPPNLSQLLLNIQNWDTYYQNCKKLSDTDRIAEYKRIAFQIANLNGYLPHKGLSKKNKRLMFKPIKAKQLFYLSLDTLHGTFELCNERGIHLGEYNFQGQMIDNPDKKGKHQIHI